ncbi:MAG TPA: hypothetical protein ENN83_15355, partial [Rhodovulum sp.]|nr:hypothetical protein [Rhodovulum sp.]
MPPVPDAGERRQDLIAGSVLLVLALSGPRLAGAGAKGRTRMDLLLAAAQVALAPAALVAVMTGCLLGVVFGAIPGLTFSVAMALVVPMSFSMETAPAIGLLLGTYIGGMTGGAVSALLLGIPGTPSAAATVLDGHQSTDPPWQGVAGAGHGGGGLGLLGHRLADHHGGFGRHGGEARAEVRPGRDLRAAGLRLVHDLQAGAEIAGQGADRRHSGADGDDHRHRRDRGRAAADLRYCRAAAGGEPAGGDDRALRGAACDRRLRAALRGRAKAAGGGRCPRRTAHDP